MTAFDLLPKTSALPLPCDSLSLTLLFSLLLYSSLTAMQALRALPAYFFVALSNILVHLCNIFFHALSISPFVEEVLFFKFC